MPLSDSWHVASVPAWVVTEWLKEAGVAWDDPAAKDVLRKKLMSGDVVNSGCMGHVLMDFATLKSRLYSLIGRYPADICYELVTADINARLRVREMEATDTLTEAASVALPRISSR